MALIILIKIIKDNNYFDDKVDDCSDNACNFDPRDTDDYRRGN